MLLTALACSETRTEPTPPAPSTEAGAAVGDTTCRREGDGCGPPAACCNERLHVVGMRVDVERKCYSARREILYCNTRDDAGGGCAADTAHDCWLRPKGDGGVEVYFTPNTWGPEKLPDFEHCDHDLWIDVTQMMNACP